MMLQLHQIHEHVATTFDVRLFFAPVFFHFRLI
jgi:hypothetical protein